MPSSVAPSALDRCKELEAALSLAVGASLPVAVAERKTFIAQHLLAQLEGLALPAAEAPTTKTTDELKDELAELGRELTEVVHTARQLPDWPIRAVASVLAPAPAPPIPPQVLAPTSAPATASTSALTTTALIERLHGVTAQPMLPVRAHTDRLPSGERRLSLAGLRRLRFFFEEHGAREKTMEHVCKEEGCETSVCALTRSTGHSLAESLVLTAEAQGDDARALVGYATTFF